MPKPDQPSAFERQTGRRTPRGRRPGPSQFEAVWEGDGEMSASVIAGSLEADGIRAIVQGIRPLPYSGMTAFGAGTWTVSVPASMAEKARALLRATGEESGIVSGSLGLEGSQAATLKLILVGVLVAVGVILFFSVRSAAGGG